MHNSQQLHAIGILSFYLFLFCAAGQGWTTARATWFDIGDDLSKANCHYSWVPTGRLVGAWPDPQEGFLSSCGKCFEIKCRNADVVDGYGEKLSRSGVCYDEGKTITITIADACPCRYPNNQYSNSRWCCGDQNHIDISAEAFQQLADQKYGVIGLYYREVDCSTTGSDWHGGGAQQGSIDSIQQILIKHGISMGDGSGTENSDSAGRKESGDYRAQTWNNNDGDKNGDSSWSRSNGNWNNGDSGDGHIHTFVSSNSGSNSGSDGNGHWNGNGGSDDHGQPFSSDGSSSGDSSSGGWTSGSIGGDSNSGSWTSGSGSGGSGGSSAPSPDQAFATALALAQSPQPAYQQRGR